MRNGIIYIFGEANVLREKKVVRKTQGGGAEHGQGASICMMVVASV